MALPLEYEQLHQPSHQDPLMAAPAYTPVCAPFGQQQQQHAWFPEDNNRTQQGFWGTFSSPSSPKYGQEFSPEIPAVYNLDHATHNKLNFDPESRFSSCCYAQSNFPR